ncbi:transposase [Streptomyces sp. NPDC048415]|uniref:transposase n=1 Tax=Streptomyces sp. NPDC048415 TaxID=3154822 RepID=UPI003449E7B3
MVKRRRGELPEFVADVVASLARQDQRRWVSVICGVCCWTVGVSRSSRCPSGCRTATCRHCHCGALGKGANCQVTVSVHAATDTASCLREGSCPGVGADDKRCQAARVPDNLGRVSKTWLALDLIDRLAAWLPTVLAIVADAG